MLECGPKSHLKIVGCIKLGDWTRRDVQVKSEACIVELDDRGTALSARNKFRSLLAARDRVLVTMTLI